MSHVVPHAECGDDRRQRLWISTLTLLVVASGMAYSIWWPSIVRHNPGYWTEPGDIWGILRVAHWVDWGGFSFIYSAPHTTVVTLPGFEVLLAPVAMISSALGLSETAPGLPPVAEPHAWLLIGPLVLATSAVALFAFDALARTLGIGLGRRRLLAVAEAAALWPTIALWGHPEAIVALGLAVFSLDQMLKRHWTTAGWLLGGALAMQLYVLALVPLLIGVVGRRRALGLTCRAAIPPGFLFVALVVPNPHDTLHALLDQPAFPKILFPTPWVLLAPKIGNGAVAGGPGRIFGFGVAIVLGIVAFRRREDWATVVWLGAAVLAARFLFEPVMVPYYVGPAVAFTLIVAARSGALRFALTCTAGAGLVESTYFHPGMWIYWLEMAGTATALLLLARPRRIPTEATTGSEPLDRDAQIQAGFGPLLVGAGDHPQLTQAVAASPSVSTSA